MKKLAGIVFALALVVTANVAIVVPAHAETTTPSTAALMETLKSLMAKVEELKAQLSKVKGEVKDTKGEIRVSLKQSLKEGMTDEDIKKVQELLASDSDIYPEGKVTGYYGNLTKEALKRFQKKHDLAVSGEINSETKELLEGYLSQRFDGKVPHGLLRAPGILKKVKDNICDSSRIVAWGLFCKDHQRDTDDDEDEDEDENEEFEVEVEIEGSTTTVSFTFDGKDYEVAVKSTSQSKVLAAVASKLKTTVSKLDKDLVKEIKVELADALKTSDKSTAVTAIDKAEDAIDAVQEDIDEADEDVDSEDAQDMLDEAKEMLEDAEEALTAKKYATAVKHAKEALKTANEAADLLEEAIEDAE